MSRVGLIAGNGRFPFLALQGARSLGYDVTIVAVKEEASTELEQAAREAAADLHWVSLGHRSGSDAAVSAHPPQGPQHRRAYFGRRRGAA